MRIAQPIRRRSAYDRRRRSAFTLVEVLAALMLVVIVLPVVMRGVTVATTAASAARRRTEASALAQSKLDELTVTLQGQPQQTPAMSGDFGDDWPEYHWTAELVNWSPNGQNMTNGLVGSQFTTQSGGGSVTGLSGVVNPGQGSLGGNTKSSSNNTLQELDVHVIWTSRNQEQSVTLGTLLYSSGNPPTITSSIGGTSTGSGGSTGGGTGNKSGG